MFYKEQEERVQKTQKHMYEAYTGKTGDKDEMGMDDEDGMDDSDDIPNGMMAQPFHFFQRALTAEWEALTDKERDQYEQKAIIWRTLGPDEEEHRK